MSKRPHKRASRPNRTSKGPPRRPSGARLLADHLGGALEWTELLDLVGTWPGLAEEIVRDAQKQRAEGTLSPEDVDRLIEGVVEHESFLAAEKGPVIKALVARINAIERAHGLAEDEYWLRHEGPPEWRMLNRAWEAYIDATMVRILESLDEHDLAEFVADRWPVEDGYGGPPDEYILGELLPENGGGPHDAAQGSGGESDATASSLTSGEDTDAPPTRVIAAVISRADGLLVCQRPAHKRHGGLWEFPGGKVEPDESDEDSARRELAEELGVQVVSADRPELETRDPGSEFLIAFVPVHIEGEPECREHSALTWGTPETLRSLPLAPSDRRYVDVLIARRASGA
jgi:8-oxo-dGTP pyrophosphatase MutT (NUDIX family)